MPTRNYFLLRGAFFLAVAATTVFLATGMIVFLTGAFLATAFLTGAFGAAVFFAGAALATVTFGATGFSSLPSPSLNSLADFLMRLLNFFSPNWPFNPTRAASSWLWICFLISLCVINYLIKW
jgi:hypothetical protein